MNKENLRALFKRTENDHIQPEYYRVRDKNPTKAQALSALQKLSWTELSTEEFIERLAEEAWRSPKCFYRDINLSHYFYAGHGVRKSEITCRVRSLRKLPPPETDILVQHIMARAQEKLNRYCQEVADRVIAAIGPIKRLTKSDADAIKGNIPSGLGAPVVEIIKDRLGLRKPCPRCGRTDHSHRRCPQGTCEANLVLIAQSQSVQQRLAQAEDLLRRVTEPALQEEIRAWLGQPY